MEMELIEFGQIEGKQICLFLFFYAFMYLLCYSFMFIVETWFTLDWFKIDLNFPQFKMFFPFLISIFISLFLSYLYSSRFCNSKISRFEFDSIDKLCVFRLKLFEIQIHQFNSSTSTLQWVYVDVDVDVDVDVELVCLLVCLSKSF